MKLTNGQIYSYALNLQSFNENNYSIPVRINFYIQKNAERIIEEGLSVEKNRSFIINKYGVEEEENPGLFHIDESLVDKAQKELDELHSIEQNIPIHKIKLSELIDSGVDLDTQDLNKILFMIEDDLSNESKED